MQVRVLNLNKCIKRIKKKADVDLSGVFNNATNLVLGDATDLAPVDTGELRRSLRARPLDGDYQNGGVVSTNVSYAIYQEYGTYKMKAQPFLRPALDKNRKYIIDSVKKALKNA